jgi:hypothetical protein
MKRYRNRLILTFTLFLAPVLAWSQQGPFSPEDWPATADPSKEVHYVVVDPEVVFDPVGANWFDGDLSVLSGGDQSTKEQAIGGHIGTKVTGEYLNVADIFFTDWGDDPVIDILIQFWGDSSILNTDGTPRDYRFLIGTLPGGADGNLTNSVGGSLPVEAVNGKWNWALFRIENGLRPDGLRYVGEAALNAEGSFGSGGVNGGTIRIQNVPGLTVRAVAFGQEGAFGEPDQINVFEGKEFCEPEPETNHVWVDIANQTSDHLVLLDDGDQTITIADNIGPANDKRRAAIADGLFMNFGIEDTYLGVDCTDPVSVKICMEYYDDPELFGNAFGPEAFATDNQGGIEIYPLDGLFIMEGTGEWKKIAFKISGVSLAGVNTGNLTGGPRLFFESSSVYISRFDLAVLRTGDHPLAGVDPIEDCYEDPNICTDLYSNYAELDLQNGVENGLARGNSGGDQQTIEAEVGPSNDVRLAIRPAFDDGSPGFNHNFMNFSITDEVFGPNSQPNAHLAICVTYYDDPLLIGATFRPQVFKVENGGTVGFGFEGAEIDHVLDGSGEWKDAYFEIPKIKFDGVNQGPQAAARFQFSDKVFFSRIRYGVIRPCGPFAGVNPLADCKPVPVEVAIGIVDTGDGSVTITWTGNLQGADNVDGDYSDVEGASPMTVTTGGEHRFYRVQ